MTPTPCRRRDAGTSLPGHVRPIEKYVLIVDIGSTFIKCTIFRIILPNNLVAVKLPCLLHVTTSRLRTPTICERPSSCEIDPEELFRAVLEVIKASLEEAEVEWDSIECVSVTSQRGTFLVMDATYHIPYHRFISWKDRRAQPIVDIWNRSIFSATVRLLGRTIRRIIAWNQAVIMSAIYFRFSHVFPRLGWSKSTVSGVDDAIKSQDARLALLDSWILQRLTGDISFKIDYSAASCTGMFNPATLHWSRPLLWYFGIPVTPFLPLVEPTISNNFGSILPKFFGTSKPIKVMIGDQQAAAFGHYLAQPGQIKLTIGTGAFLTVHCGSELIFDLPKNIYTIIGWKLGIDDKPAYLTETHVEDFSRIVSFSYANDLHLEQCTELPEDVEELPYFCGKTCSYVDNNGNDLKENCLSPHVQRFLVIELLAYLIASHVFLLGELVDLKYPLRVDGGFSAISILLEIVATLINQPLERPDISEMTSFGAALLAGVGMGYWSIPEVEQMTAAVPRKRFCRTKLGIQFCLNG